MLSTWPQLLKGVDNVITQMFSLTLVHWIRFIRCVALLARLVAQSVRALVDLPLCTTYPLLSTYIVLMAVSMDETLLNNNNNRNNNSVIYPRQYL